MAESLTDALRSEYRQKVGATHAAADLGDLHCHDDAPESGMKRYSPSPSASRYGLAFGLAFWTRRSVSKCLAVALPPSSILLRGAPYQFLSVTTTVTPVCIRL